VENGEEIQVVCIDLTLIPDRGCRLVHGRGVFAFTCWLTSG